MPLHLPPLSRRKFISRSLAAAAGAALAPKCFAAVELDSNAVALLADPHIAADRATVSNGVNMTEHLESVARELIALRARPGNVMVAGDCAFKSGEVADYASFARLLEPVREAQMPVHLALGNHDNREHFWEALQAEKSAPHPVPDRQAAIVRSPLANWFILDSLDKTLVTPGLLGKEQLDWLAKTLDENSDKPAVLLVHHNPGKLANVEGVKDTEDLFAIIRPRKQVKAWIFGHTHHWSTTEDASGIHLVNLPPVGYVFQKGDPSGWILARFEKDGFSLEMRCTDPSHARHGQVYPLKWRV